MLSRVAPKCDIFPRWAAVLLLLISAACQPTAAKDTPVTATVPPSGDPGTITAAVWDTSNFLSPTATVLSFPAAVLTSGGPATPLALTYAQANLPAALFSGATKDNGSGVIVSPVPFLALTAEAGSVVNIRHIKTVNGQVVDSAVVVPVACPDPYTQSLKLQNGDQAFCLPLINIAIPGFLVPTDNSGAYVHEFIVSAKTPSKTAVAISTKVATTVIIPNSTLSVAESPDMDALSLSDRLTIATNDLVGSPRRDFKAFEVKGLIAPGVNTSWLLTFTGVVMTFEEEIFFEQPVVPGANPAQPTVSRGSGFYKRSTTIDSTTNFRLKVQDAYKAASNFNVSTTNGAALIEIPIADGTNPLDVFLVPDFGSDTATQSMSEYVKPFGPTFCPKEQDAFKPEEWRQSRTTVGFEACDANTRTRVVDATDAIKQGISSPLETFFGSFSYMPRIGQRTLGGTNGILTLRISLAGTLQAAVRNPSNPQTSTIVGTMPLAFSYQFPTVLSEMNNLLAAGGGTPGLDTIQSAMTRKGIVELPRLNAGVTPAFPFLTLSLDHIFY